MRILIVDDDPLVIELYRLFASELGVAEILQVTSGEDAVFSYHHNSVDVIIMDYHILGSFNGAKLTKELRKRGFGGQIIANSSDEPCNLKIVKAGADRSNPYRDKTPRFLLELIEEGSLDLNFSDDLSWAYG